METVSIDHPFTVLQIKIVARDTELKDFYFLLQWKKHIFLLVQGASKERATEDMGEE